MVNKTLITHSGSLNPYSTGCWFAGYLLYPEKEIISVLILILLDVGLLDLVNIPTEIVIQVLILILLDVGLLELYVGVYKMDNMRLNPYSTGCWFAGKLRKITKLCQYL